MARRGKHWPEKTVLQQGDRAINRNVVNCLAARSPGILVSIVRFIHRRRRDRKFHVQRLIRSDVSEPAYGVCNLAAGPALRLLRLENRPMAADTQKNEGEGNRSAAREYNKTQQDFASSGKVGPAAADAARAVDGPEGADLRKAVELGKRHSRGEDPALKK